MGAFLTTVRLAAPRNICPRCSNLVWVFVTHRSEFIKAVVTAWVSYWGAVQVEYSVVSNRGKKGQVFRGREQRVFACFDAISLTFLSFRNCQSEKERYYCRGMRDKR